jgi:hypothetical protein
MSQPHNYLFLLTFSVLVCVFCILHLPFPTFNAAIYSSTICALIGFTLILILNPTGLYSMYGDTIKHILNVFGVPSWAVNIYTFNIVAFLIHLAPVYFYRNVYPLGNPLPIMIIWVIIFFPVIRNMYPFDEYTMIGIGILTYLLFLAGTYILFGQNSNYHCNILYICNKKILR